MDYIYVALISSVVTYALLHLKQLRADVTAIDAKILGFYSEVKAELSKLTGGKL